MKKRELLLLTGLLTLALTLFGCTAKNNAPVNQSQDLAAMQMAFSDSKNLPIKTVDYDFGKKTIAKSENIPTDFSYFLRGIISYPSDKKEGLLKPIIILHGNHDNSDSKRYDMGFKYLTEYLAQNGYLALSLDINAAYNWSYGDNLEYDKIPILFGEHIKLLQELNKGKANNLGIDLKDRIDFSQSLLIGHSTGGQLIFDIAADQEKYGLVINNLLPIAPTINNDDTVFDLPMDNIAILIPELDGDVVNLDGLGIKNAIRNSDKQKMLSSVVLKNANHNYFNSVLTINDAESRGGDLSKQLTPEAQRDFLKKFAVDFANAAFSGNYEKTIYDINNRTVNQLGGFDIVTSLDYAQKADLLNILDKTKLEAQDVAINYLQESVDINTDNAIGMNIPLRKADIMDLLNIKWQKNGAVLAMQTDIKDLSDYKNINIQLVLDPSDQLNPAKAEQGFSLKFSDAQGNSDTIVIKKGSGILPYPQGKMDGYTLENGRELKFWDNNTLLTNLQIPISLLSSIDTSQLQKVDFIFDQSASGSIMIESIKAMK